MAMVNILKNHDNRVIRKYRFLITRIIGPITVLVILADVTTISNPRKIVFAIGELIPMISDKWKSLIGQIPLAYFPFILLCYFVLYLVVIHKILGQKQILPANHYFLVPSWMIKWASFINRQHSGSATSIPTWQFCEYLYYQSTFGWREMTLEIPEVMPAESNVEVTITVSNPSHSELDTSVLSLVVSDTYPADLKSLPCFVIDHRYEVFQTMKDGQVDRVRRYNSDLVSVIVKRVRRAETEGVKSLYLLLNTNPKQISEIFRELFTDAGRNPIEHLYVYESQSNPPYHFLHAHRIF